ncbi:MAG TPA: sugar-binding transcriptional regulator [Dictyobacter sp.]|nr:sugar-binding transcriptional regulator [Dictyobacter sp.]
MANKDEEVLYRIARQYYIESLTQEEIARQLHVSRGYVSRLLQKCLGEGIVQVQIQYPFLTNATLEKELRQQFGLKDAVVVAPGHEGEAVAAVGRAGAYYLQTVVGPEDILGVSWGSTLWQVVYHLIGSRDLKLEVVQLMGGMANTDAGTQPNEVARLFALAFGGMPYYLPAPLYLDEEETARALYRGSIVGSTMRKARAATVTMVGIGAIVPGTSLFRSAGLSADVVARLQELGAVGDICGRFYLIDGTPCPSDLNERTMAIKHEELSRVPTVIGVASGDIKTQAILGALRGKLVNVFITDEKTAENVLTYHHIAGLRQND